MQLDNEKELEKFLMELECNNYVNIPNGVYGFWENYFEDGYKFNQFSLNNYGIIDILSIRLNHPPFRDVKGEISI